MVRDILPNTHRADRCSWTLSIVERQHHSPPFSWYFDLVHRIGVYVLPVEQGRMRLRVDPTLLGRHPPMHCILDLGRSEGLVSAGRQPVVNKPRDGRFDASGGYGRELSSHPAVDGD